MIEHNCKNESNYYDIYFDEGQWLIGTQCDHVEDIKFCPWCGKELEK